MKSLLCLAAIGALAGADDDLRFIDGVPLGGPRPVASAMEWAVGHYSGPANATLYAEGKGKRLEYVVNLGGRQKPVAWASRVVLKAPGRTPATCIILSDGDPERKAATVEAWYVEGKVAIGAAAFALGIDGASTAFSQRARHDLPPVRAQPLGDVRSFAGEISAMVTGVKRNGRVELQIGLWEALLVGGQPARIVAAQQRSLRLLTKVSAMAHSLPGRWGCAVVSGFPSKSGDNDPGTMPFTAWRWQSTTGERLLLMQSYLGDADAVSSLGVTMMHEHNGTLDRRGEAWRWDGADWIATPAWNAVSPVATVSIGVAP